MTAFTESVVEDVALVWLESLVYAVKNGAEIVHGELFAEQMATRAQNATVQLRGNMQDMHIAASNGMIVQGQIRGKPPFPNRK